MANESALPADIVELLAFWVADEEYSVDILDIQEIIKLPEITEVPRANDCLLGHHFIARNCRSYFGPPRGFEASQK